ncbi:MAG: hypothetical protein UV58_C0013G0023 [Candidatus Wolfebacteria bacterium GW2011_GWC1_43_10]|uniref:Uncharacterized protein n=1 Tax=Candidatus Wolfebacteria bacterium GW2011_GWC1_43_10 TaxID=1619011 RepID=A0A0G1C8U0_9BACT|nr:MAG: hypothetical protein UV58_C0013G0023 [Candidatus Wolfebacteria bacterium GW2011_GWC1_43_10]HZX13035.1 hypothetical protein [Thermodesulfobacteriota bacterium]
MPVTKIINQDFNIALADGGKFIKGIITISPDGKINKKLTDSSDPLPLEFYEDALKLIRMVADLEIKYDGIKTIEFTEKV